MSSCPPSSSASSSDPDPVTWTTRSRVVAGVLSLAAFLTQFDVTAVAIVLPTIVGELQLGVSGFAWVMDAYSLAFTAALLAAGALADRFGRRRCLLVGNLLFLAASVACGLAWHGPSLWAARVVPGVGAALLVALGMLAIGAGAALAHPQLSGAVLALAPAEQAGMASAVTVVARQAGFAIGIAALGAVLGSTRDGAGFAAPFALATGASLAGVVAAWALLPHRSGRHGGALARPNAVADRIAAPAPDSAPVQSSR